MALGDWLNGIFNSTSTPADQLLGKAGYQQYQLSGPAPTTGYGVSQIAPNAAGAGGTAQAGLLKQLQDQAGGVGPNVAEQQLQTDTSQGIANQAALAASNAGGNQNPGAIAEAQARAAAAARQTAAGQAAQLRSQNILGAQGAEAGLAGTIAGQNIGIAGTNAAAQNAEGQLASGQNQQNYEYANSLAAQQQSQYDQYLAQLTGAQQGQNAGFLSSLIQGVGSAANAGASAAIASDEEVKTQVAGANQHMNQFLDSLDPRKYANAPGPAFQGPNLAAGLNFGGKPGGAPAAPGAPAPAAPSDPGAPYGIDNGPQEAYGGTGTSGDPTAPELPQASSAGGGFLRMSPNNPLTQVASGGDPELSRAENSAMKGFGGSEAISDAAAKNDITSATGSHQQLLDALQDSSHSYKYKDPGQAGAAPGKHFGPMAQEIEDGGPVGESVVHDGPDGVKRVDTGRLSLALASGVGQLHKRLSDIEEMLKSKYGRANG